MQELARSNGEHAYKSRTVQGFVYFVQVGQRGPIKIGYARDPEERCTKHQVSNHHPLVLLGAYPGTMADERALHQRFAASRIRGEWFKTSRALQKEAGIASDYWLRRQAQRNLDANAEALRMAAAWRAAA